MLTHAEWLSLSRRQNLLIILLIRLLYEPARTMYLITIKKQIKDNIQVNFNLIIIKFKPYSLDLTKKLCLVGALMRRSRGTAERHVATAKLRKCRRGRKVGKPEDGGRELLGRTVSAVFVVFCCNCVGYERKTELFNVYILWNDFLLDCRIVRFFVRKLMSKLFLYYLF